MWGRGIAGEETALPGRGNPHSGSLEPPLPRCLSLGAGGLLRGRELTWILPQTCCLSIFTVLVNGPASARCSTKNLWVSFGYFSFPLPQHSLKPIHHVPPLFFQTESQIFSLLTSTSTAQVLATITLAWKIARSPQLFPFLLPPLLQM